MKVQSAFHAKSIYSPQAKRATLFLETADKPYIVDKGPI